MRAFTFLEVIVALTLMSILALASLSWVQTAMGFTVRAGEPMEWETAARAVLSLIHDDAATGDFGDQTEAAIIEIEDNVLEIRTRTRSDSAHPIGVSIIHRFSWNKERNEIRFEEIFPDMPEVDTGEEPSTDQDRGRRLLGDVLGCEMRVTESPHSLSVILTGPDGREHGISAFLPYPPPPKEEEPEDGPGR